MCYSLNGNTNFQIRFVFGICNTRHLAIGARNIQRFVYVFKSILFFVTHGIINFTSLNDTFIFLGTNTINSVKNNHCE